MSASDIYSNPTPVSPPLNSARPIDVTAESNGNGNPVAPFRSAEAFDSYCCKIQQRLAEHAALRSQFLQTAYDRLTRLMQAARDVEDTALYQELGQHRIAARELLDALGRASQLTPAPSVSAPAASLAPSTIPTPPVPGPSKPLPIHSLQGRYTPAPSDDSPTIAPRLHASPASSAISSLRSAPAGEQEPTFVSMPVENVPRIPRRPLRPLADIEADAMYLRGELKDCMATRPLQNRQGDLNIPNCLLLRSLACRQRRLEEEAGDTEVAEVTELRNDIVDLLDAANDQEYTVALDDDIDPRPTAYQWGEMAERYEEMARAQEAFDWWQRHRGLLSVSDIQPMAEAIASVQQRFNRILFRVGARDPFQQALFDELRVWAREAQCYLQSLRPKVPTAELIERASALEPSWDNCRAVVEEEDRRNQTVENVIALVSEPDFGAEGERDEERLRNAVWECRQFRIAASDRRLRDALLPWAAFLENDDRFRDVLREINLEWERRQDLGKPEEATEEDDQAPDSMLAELEAVKEITRGKRCLLLGGTCREENRRKIEDALELSELVWPSTKPSDPLSKYDTDIRHSDIVALLTRFSRKEWKNAQDICARDGKKFVHLTSGYGVSQVVRHFYTQLCPEATNR